VSGSFNLFGAGRGGTVIGRFARLVLVVVVVVVVVVVSSFLVVVSFVLLVSFCSFSFGDVVVGVGVGVVGVGVGDAGVVDAGFGRRRLFRFRLKRKGWRLTLSALFY